MAVHVRTEKVVKQIVYWIISCFLFSIAYIFSFFIHCSNAKTYFYKAIWQYVCLVFLSLQAKVISSFNMHMVCKKHNVSAVPRIYIN